MRKGGTGCRLRFSGESKQISDDVSYGSFLKDLFGSNTQWYCRTYRR